MNHFNIFFWNENLFLKKALLLFLSGCSVCIINAQKPAIDTGVFDKWPEVREGAISSNGQYVLYSINQAAYGSATLVVCSTFGNWKEKLEGSHDAKFTDDSKLVVFLQGEDSLCLLRLGSGEREYIGGVFGRYQLSGDDTHQSWLAYRRSGPDGLLILRNLFNGTEYHYTGVADYKLSNPGSILLLQSFESSDSGKICILRWVNTVSGKEQTIWRGRKARGYVFNEEQNEVCFFTEKGVPERTERCLWYYRLGDTAARVLVQSGQRGVDSTLTVSNEPPIFSHDGKRLIFKLVENRIPQPLSGSIQVDIWSYRDPMLQSSQLQDIGPAVFLSVVNVKDGQMSVLQEKEETTSEPLSQYDDEVRLIQKGNGNMQEWNWNAASRPTIYLVSTIDGSRQLVQVHANPILSYELSPNGRWLIFFDLVQQAYFSFDRQKGRIQNLTKGISELWGQEELGSGGVQTPGLIGPFLVPAGIGGWLEGNDRVLVYGRYDIWKLDLLGKAAPVNLTSGYGKAHRIRLRLAEQEYGSRVLRLKDEIYLSAFDERNKTRGFYRLAPGGIGMPDQLSMGGWNTWTIPQKARDANFWLVGRMSATEYPNYWVSRDLRQYRPVSTLAPQKEYNWLTTTLVHWKGDKGQAMSGLLYKPEDFDATKHYPVILTYYEHRSDELNDFLQPASSIGPINIPYFVSHEYVVFVPDIELQIGVPGKSALQCVVSATKYLSRQPWVDPKRIGIDGHSFGGFETNYLITHCNLFAAAAEASGPTDCISHYGGLMYGSGKLGTGTSAQFEYEIAQLRIGASLWQRPDLYIQNSPILRADRVTTPLLMMHNKNDGTVPFGQAVELFTAMRRLGKRVWFLQYDQAGHILGKATGMDYTIRLKQFFDYYLKGVAAPIWMTVGIPARMKGIESGLSLDDKNPKP